MARATWIGHAMLWGMLSLSVIGVGCGGGGGGDGGSNDGSAGPAGGSSEAPATSNFGIVMGKVTDMQGQPLGGVTLTTFSAGAQGQPRRGARLTASGVTATSNEQGFFSMDEIAETDLLMVHFEKEGYVPTSAMTKIQTGLSSFLEPVMCAYEETDSIDAQSGGEVSTDDGGSVDIEGGTLVDSSGNAYVGEVRVSLTTFDPTTENGIRAFPGDFEGVRIDGTTVPFESYGYMDITVVGAAGEQLQLAPNTTTDIRVPIPTDLLASAPAEVPLWFFDKNDGQWKEERMMTKDGDQYVGFVTHFSPYNVDDPMWGLSRVRGVVIDRFGRVVRGARVTVRGLNWMAGESSTDGAGVFAFPAQADSTGSLYASKGGAQSDPVEIQTAAQFGDYDHGEIRLGSPLVQASLTWGENPDDLDAHLSIPTESGDPEHIFWMNKGGEGSEATLDTDDVDGKGPEITSIYALKNGTYRYSVHHFTGDGNIVDTSQAVVNLIVDGLGIYTFNPPPGAATTGEDDVWHVFDLTVSNGAVIQVLGLHSIVTNATFDDVFHP